MLYGKRDPGDQDPDHIYDEGDSPAAVDDLLAKRKERHRRKLKALDAVGDPDDRDAPQTPREHPAEPADTASKDKPQKISKTTHFHSYSYLRYFELFYSILEHHITFLAAVH